MKTTIIYEKNSLRYTTNPSELPEIEFSINSKLLPLSEDYKKTIFSDITNLSNEDCKIDGLYNLDPQININPYKLYLGIHFRNFLFAVSLINEDAYGTYSQLLEEIYNIVNGHKIDIFDKNNAITLEFQMILARKYVGISILVPFYELPSWGKDIYTMESLYKFIVLQLTNIEFDNIYIELLETDPFWKVIRINNIIESTCN